MISRITCHINGLRERKNFAWGFADQGLSSATNLGFAVLGGRLLGPYQLGVILLGFSFYLAALGFQRALLSDPLVASTSSLDPAARRRTGGFGATICLAGGCVATALCVAIGVTLGGDLGRGMLLFAPWLLPALLQDLWRVTLFRDERPRTAATNDAVWLAVMLALIPLAWRIGEDWALVACWGAGAATAAILGLLQTRFLLCGLHRAVTWWKCDVWPFARWLITESLVFHTLTYCTAVVLAAVLTAGDYGGLRAVQTVFGPLTLLIPAVALPGLPALSRAVDEPGDEAWTLSLRISAVVTGVTMLYVVISSFVPGILSFVYGSPFERFRELILPVGLAQIGTACVVGWTLLLVARRRGSALAGLRIAVSLLTFALSVLLGMQFGVGGVAWGIVATAFLAAIGTAALVISREEPAFLGKWQRAAA